jgi:hypothetical protein
MQIIRNFTLFEQKRQLTFIRLQSSLEICAKNYFLTSTIRLRHFAKT